MARYGSDGESKQGLTIALVMFVLLSIVLGLMAYFGYAESHGMTDKLSKLEGDNKSLRGQLDEAKLRAAMGRLTSGYGNAKEERDDLQTVAGLKNQKSLSEAYESEYKKINAKGGKWDPDTGKPEFTFAARMAEMQNQVAAEQKASKEKGDQLTKVTADYQRDMGAMRDLKTKAEQALAMTKDDVDKRIKNVDDNYNKVVKEFTESIVKAEDYEKKLAELNKQKNEIEAKLAAAIKDAELKVKKLEEKLPQIDLLAYDKPKGKITRVDMTSKIAYINIGSAELVKPGLTFSIFGQNQYRANAERKASIEVINVVGDHLSSARITEVRSPARDPILTGDELYNPAWRPGYRERVAIAGLIDLTGDGRDGTLEFVRNLEKQGVAVDAYLDARELVVKGKGITRNTDYLVLGEVLEFQQQEKIREGDARQERKMNINQEVAKMREDALRLGVTIVPARRFMAMMGYKLPRTPSTIDDWNAYLIRRPAGEAAPKDMKGAEPKEMKKGEEKKAEDKKDAKEK
jgi:hypothetical protein